MSLHNEQVQKEIDAVQKEIDDLKTVPLDVKALKALLMERTRLEAKLIDG